MLRLHSERGDTIVEVLVVLTILATAFGISYATANSSLITSRSSQEHSEALHFLSQQLELVRSGAEQNANSVFTGPGSFCMAGSPTTPVLFTPSYDATTVDATNDDFSKYPVACVQGEQNLFHLSVTYVAIPVGNPGAFDVFTLKVRWDGPSTNGRQEETLTYKLHPGSTIAGFDGSAAAPSAPPPPPSPSCPPAVPSNKFDACYYSDTSQSTVAYHQMENAPIDYDWGTGSPAPGLPSDNFSVRWQGKWRLADGNYTFTTTADDGVRITVDGAVIIDKYFDQSPTTYTASVDLSGAAPHTIKMDYYERTGGAVAKLSWALTPPPPTPPSLITPSTPSKDLSQFGYGCYYQSDGTTVAPNVYKTHDNDDNTGIVVNCGSTTYLIYDLGAYYTIDKITIAWGPFASNVNQWFLFVSNATYPGGSHNNYCYYGAPGYRYDVPTATTTDTTPNYCAGSGPSGIRYVWIGFSGPYGYNVGVNEVKVYGR